jgi:hypothetical protein
MSSYSENIMFNPIPFEQASGPLFNEAEGPMNGDKQEEAYDFIQKLLPEFGDGELFEAVCRCKKSCWKCGKEMSASITRSGLLLEIPENLNRLENKVELNMSSATA